MPSPRRVTADDISTALDTLDKPTHGRPRGDGDRQFFGSYQIIGRIGTGGAADVFRARHIHPNYAERTFALKLLHRDGAADGAMRDLFRNEAYLMSLLRHPNIVRTFQAGVEDDKLFLVMEYISGRDLWELLERSRQLGVRICDEVLLHILGEILRGLSFAHGLRDADGEPLNVIHHDVNPTNCFLAFDGTVKLGDFGVAVITAEDSEQEGLGKVGYFAPEQFVSGPVDQRVDLFSFGVMMYELLCGTAPFEDDDPDRGMQRNSQARFTPPRVLVPEMDPGLERIIMRALQRKPEDRYPSTHFMLGALESYLPKRAGMKLAVAAYMRQLLLNEYVHEIKLRQGLEGADANEAVGNRVAVLSGEPETRHLWRETLRERGFSGRDYADIQSLADDLLAPQATGADGAPDALVVDVQGWEFAPEPFLEALGKTGKVVPVVAAVEDVHSERAAAARRIGAVDLIYQPLDANRVQTAMWVAIKGGNRQTTTPEVTESNTGLRVLLVSHDSHLASTLTAELPRWRYALDVAPATEEALAATREATFHAVLFDAYPEVTDVAREFAEHFRAAEGMGIVPILYLTAAEETGKLNGITRSAVRVRTDSPVILATTLAQLRADTHAGRSFVRYRADFNVEMRFGGRSYAAKAADISRGGIMLRCKEIPPVGTEVHLLLSLPERDPVVEVPARVVRVMIPRELGQQPAVGIEFSGFGARNERELVAFLHVLARRAEAMV